MSASPTEPCPCGGGRPFGSCCEPILTQQKPAATAEELMRSRFTAHVRKNFEHLHRTYLKTKEEPYVAPAAGGNEWTRLVVHAHEPGAAPETAYVDFSAYYREGTGENALHEKAAFKRIDGTWYYSGPVRTGPAPIRAAQSKVGRNAPCPCGSGKKHKHCCGK